MGCCTSLYVSSDTFYPLVYVPSHDLELPQAKVPQTRRDNIFDMEKYQKVEKHVTKSLPNKILYGSFHTVAKYLCQPAPDDLGKVWALYKWVATVDPNSIKLDPDNPPYQDSPLDYLMKIREKESNQALLFAALARAADIPCVIINGISKNSDYHLGSELDRYHLSAQWNAVYVRNQWFLLDVLWGSQSITGKRTDDWAIVDADGDVINSTEKNTDGNKLSGFNDFYFMTDPDMFICTHLPEDPTWQLLPSPITERIFTSRVYVRERFFEMGCTIISDELFNAILKTKQGKQTIKFGLPSRRSIGYDFKYLLFKDPKSCPNIKNKDLRGAVFHESKPDLLSYDIQFPTVGLFRFDVFGVDVEIQDSFDLIASYVIDCGSPCPDFEMLPDMPEIGWGPGIEMKRMGLTPITHDSAIIDTTDGTCQIRFKMSKQLSFGIQLKHNDIEDWNLENHVLLSTEGAELSIDVRLPQKGQYALKIFARQGESPGKLENICNYLVKNIGIGSKLIPFPNVHNDVLSKSLYVCERYGIEALSHITNKITCSTQQTHLTFVVQKAEVELLGHVSGPNLNDGGVSECLSRKMSDNETQFTLNMSTLGEYALNVYARETEQKLLYHVQSYLITKTQNEDGKIGMPEHPLGPICPKEAITISGTQINISHLTNNKKAASICFQNKFQTYLPGSYLDKSINITETGVGINMIVTISPENIYKLDIYEETASGSGCILIRKCVRLIPPVFDAYEDQPTISGIMQVTSGSYQSTPFDPIAMRARLKMVLVLKHPGFADAALARCRNNGYHDDDLVPRVQHITKLHRAKSDLTKYTRGALKTGVTGPLERALDAIEENGIEIEMGIQLVVARMVLLHKLNEKIRKMDQTTVAEVKSYSAPPKATLAVMKASLLLLGHKEKELKDWESMRALIGDTQKMKQRLKDVDVEKVDEEVALEAQRMVINLTRDEVHRTSEVVDAFYAWSINFIKLKLTR